MSFENIPNRTTSDSNAAADINQLSENIRVISGNGESAPTTSLKTLDEESIKRDGSIPMIGALISNGQINFPAIQNASADGNTLDDYEEGTYEPVTMGGTAAGVGTYTSRTGSYTKIGNLVFFTAKIVQSAHTGTGVLRVSLPFPAAGECALSIGASLLLHVATLCVLTVPSQSYCELRTFTPASGALTNVAMDVACTIIISGCYQV